MAAPVQQTGRNRRNVMTGAPDVKYSGGFFIGSPSQDPTLFPSDALEATEDIIERLGLESGGYITSDGVSEAEERSTEKILDWNLDVIDIVETDYSLQLTVTFAEAANAAVLRFLYGDDNVDVTEDGVYIRKGARQLDNAAIMFDIKGKGGAAGRGYADEVQVASIGEDIAYNKQGLIQYQATIDVLNDVTGTYMHTWLTQRGVVAPTEPGDGENPQDPPPPGDPVRQVTVQALRDPWDNGDLDGWVPDSQAGDLDIFVGFDYLDFIDEGIVWDLHFTVPVTCEHPLLGVNQTVEYPAGTVIPAGAEVNPPVPNEGLYTFTEAV